MENNNEEIIYVNSEKLSNDKEDISNIFKKYNEFLDDVNNLYDEISNYWDGDLKNIYMNNINKMNECFEIGSIMFESTISNLDKTIENYKELEKQLEENTDVL